MIIRVLRNIYMSLLMVMALTACHDNELTPGNGGAGQNYIAFSTRAGGYSNENLPGQSHTVQVDGTKYNVPQSIGVFGFLMDETYTKVLDVDKPVFDNVLLKEYDATLGGDAANPVYPDVVEVTPEEQAQARSEEWENLETLEYGAPKGDDGSRENLTVIPAEQADRYEGSVTRPDGTVTDSVGNVLIEGEGEEHPDNPDGPDNPSNPDETALPFGTEIAEGGIVKLVDGTNITQNGMMRPYTINAGTQNAINTQLLITPSGTYRISSQDGSEISDEAAGVEKSESSGITTFNDGMELTADYVKFSMMTDATATSGVYVTWYFKRNSLTFQQGNENPVTMDLNKIWSPNADDTNSPSPVKRHDTRAGTVYDDEYDKYYWGYNPERWTSGYYAFYAYSPCSQYVDFDINETSDDPDVKGTIGKFTWGKIPSISTTDYMVAKAEVWRHNDPSRIHFDDMQHLMSRIRVNIAVHPDFHRIRRIVVTNVSLTVLEPGFNRIYTYTNQRKSGTAPETGAERELESWTEWTDPSGAIYLYNPAKHPATYAEKVTQNQLPSDAISYPDGKYGKLLYPLAKKNEWKSENIYTDFFIVPFLGNAATELTLRVSYDIYDTDVCNEDGTPIPGNFTPAHLVRSCTRLSTLDCRANPIRFHSGESRALNVLINPNYIYTLFDHDEPADMIIE